MKSDSSGEALLKRDGVSYSEAQDKAEILSSQFSSEYTEEGISSIPDLGSGIPATVPPRHIEDKISFSKKSLAKSSNLRSFWSNFV